MVEPFTRAWQTLRDLIAYLRDVYHITHVAGHHDFQPAETECPGAHLRKRLPTLAAELKMKWGIDGYVVPEWIKPDKYSSFDKKEWAVR